MGIPLIQACNPEIQSCDISQEGNTTTSTERNSPPLASFDNTSQNWEKYQNTPIFFNSLWAPNSPVSYRPESVIISETERTQVLGAYLASLPTSPEELKTTDPTHPVPANTPQDLSSIWDQLPLQVRVYLDQAGLKGEKNLGIIYETENPDFPEGRWRVFQKEEKQETQMAAAGMGIGVLAFLNKPVGNISSPEIPQAQTPPPNKPSMNVRLGSFIAGSVMVIGIDFAIKKAFPNLPPEAHIVPNLGTFYLFQYIAYQAGFTKAGSWGEVWRPMTGQLPMMAALGIPTSMLVDGFGRMFKIKAMQNEGGLHGPLTALGTLGLHYGLMKTAAGRSFLTASGSGLAGTAGRVVRVGGAALILSALCRGAKAGGAYLGLMLGGARPGDYAWREGMLRMTAEKLELAHLSQDALGETGGSIVDSAIGGLLDGVLSIGAMISDDVAKGREMEIDEFRQKLIQEGTDVSKNIRTQILSIVNNATNSTGETDWNQVQHDISELYGDKNTMEAVYQNFELTGHILDEAEEIRLSIGVDGSIQNKNLLLKIAQSEGKKYLSEHRKELGALPQKQAELQKLGEDIGYIQIRNGSPLITPPELLSIEQRRRVENEYLPLAGQVTQLEQLAEEASRIEILLRNSGKK